MRQLVWLVLAASMTACAGTISSAQLADVSGSAPRARSDATVVHGPVGEAVDVAASRYAEYGWQYSLLVAQDNQVLLQKAYGPGLSPDSVFNAASVAKQFTATAIVKLASTGKLRLDDPITRFFPEAPKQFGQITLDHILSHTSGMRDDYSFIHGFPDRNSLLKHLFSKPLASIPGQEWSYCNFCYSLLTIVVERVSGQPYKRYMRQQLFQPAGLQHTGFAGDNSWPISQRPIAIGGSVKEYPRVDRWGFGLGASDVVTSPADLLRWLQALKAGAILPEVWRAKLDEPLKEVFGGLKYGRGWWTRNVELAGTRRLNIWHSGQEEYGASAWVNRYPAEGLVTIFLTNQAYEGQPIREMLNSAGGPSVIERIIYGGDLRLPPRVVDLPGLAGFVGRYETTNDGWIDVRADGRFLAVTPHGQAAFNALIPSDAGKRATDVLTSATIRTAKILREIQRDGASASFIRNRDPESPLPPELAHFESFEVLGSTPINAIGEDGGGRVVTYFILRQNGRDHVWRMHWVKEESGAVYESEAPVQPLFRAIGPSEFANWHPFVRGSAFLRFEGDRLYAGKVMMRRRAS